MEPSADRKFSPARFAPGNWSREIYWGIGLVLLVMVAFAPAVGSGFIWDDDVYVTANPLLTAPDGLKRIWFSFDSLSQYFPLTYTSFYFERGVWGLNPAGYHLVNLLLHAANVLLVWRILRRLNVTGAWLAAAIFAVHPVQVETVAWITERKNLLMAIFYLLGVWHWLNFLDDRKARGRWYYAGALLCCILALLAKTTACTFFAAQIAVLWLTSRPIHFRRVLQIVPFVLAGIAMGVITMWWERFHQGTQGKLFHLDLIERFLLANRALWFYVGKLLWPTPLEFSYPHWQIDRHSVEAWAWVVLTLLAIAGGWAVRKRWRHAVPAGALFFSLTLAPLLGFVMLYTFLYSYVADHYQYLACLGLIALASAGAVAAGTRLLRRVRWGKAIAAGIVLTLLMALSVRQSLIYASPETLWRATLAENPDSWLARVNLGQLLYQQGKLDDAEEEFRRTLVKNPECVEAFYNLGVIANDKGDPTKALTEFRRALACNPDMIQAQDNLGITLLQVGQVDEAIEHLQRAVQLDPRVKDGQSNLGLAYAQKGDFTTALRFVRNAVELDANNPDYRNSLARVLVKSGETKAGVAEFEKNLRANSNYVPSYNDLAWILATSNDATVRNGAQALELTQQAQRMVGAPNSALLRTLAAAQAANGDFAAAVQTAADALRLAEREKDAALIARLRNESAFYQAKKPWRE